MSEPQTLWIGRVLDDEGREHTVRCFTDGSAPGPDAIIECIADPFLAACPPMAGTAAVSALEVAMAAPTIEGGPGGELGQHVLAPPVRPNKVFGVGRNYRDHAAELGNAVPDTPLVFLKAPSCLLASGAPIELPNAEDRVDLEGELVVVVGRVSRRLDRATARQSVAGYCLGNDVSNRVQQQSDKQWTRAKGFDTAGPAGPMIRMEGGGPPPGARIRSFVNDLPCQDAPMSDMVFGIDDILVYLSASLTLWPGDLIYMGTPAGVRALSSGDVARVECDGFELGRLTNTVRRAGPA